MQKLPGLLVTGVTGYVGSHILKQLLVGEGKGKYAIRCMVRSQKKLKPLYDNIGAELLAQVEFVNGDLLDQTSIEAAVNGVQYIIHTASPVNQKPKRLEDVIEPAVKGVQHIMEAAKKFGVKRVVITSSAAAIVHPSEELPDVYTEEDWTDIKVNYVKNNAYYISKTLSERWAWDFIEKNQSEGRQYPELATICPSMCLGEVVASGDMTSPHTLMSLFYDVHNMYMLTVDVLV